MNCAGKSILVAEDNTVLADVLRFNLTRQGYAVTIARTGQEAACRVRSQRFDLLITDYNMPEVNGEELIRLIRDELHLHDLPIIMCSAKGLELDCERLSAEWQIHRVVYKPFSMREIMSLAAKLTAPPTTAI